MTTVAIIGEIQQMAFENERLKDELEKMKGNHCDAQKFYGVAVGVEFAATLHNVHADTVRKYANLGLISKHPDSTDGKMLFRASDIILLDFTELRRLARVSAYIK